MLKTMAEPKLEILYSDMVLDIQQSLSEQGLMKPVKIERFTREIDSKIAAYREVYGDYLRREWEQLFPGVPFSDELFSNELEKALLSKRDAALDEFYRQLERLKKLKMFRNFVFRKPSAHQQHQYHRS